MPTDPHSRTVTRLLVSPIKGLRVRDVDRVTIEDHGAVGDRDFFLVDEEDRLCSVTALGNLLALEASWSPGDGRLGLLRDGKVVLGGEVVLGESVNADFYGHHVVPGRLVEGDWSAVLSDVAQRPLRLVKCDETGAGSDHGPVTILSEASIAELSRHAPVADVDPRRFRMLINCTGPRPHEEDEWEDQSVTVGEVLLRAGKKVGRCAAITRNPQSGIRDSSLVKSLRDYRGIQPTGYGEGVPLGIYAFVLRPGEVRIGDPVTVA